MGDIVSKHLDEAKVGCHGNLTVFVQWNRSAPNLTGVKALRERGNLGGILSSLSSFSDVVGEWRMGREGDSSWLPDGYSQILRLNVFDPSGLKDYSSATLRCKI